MNVKVIAAVAMVITIITIKLESSSGIRHENNKAQHLAERIQKSRHTIVHSIEVKSQEDIL